MPMKKLSCGAKLWLDLWFKISLKLSWIVLFKTFEHKQTQIVIIQALNNINTTLNFKVEIAGAGSLNIRTCKNYWQLFTANFEPKFLLNFLDIWKKNYKKRTNWFGQNGKIIKITQVSRKISVQKRKKKVKGKCTCCFGSKFVL